MSNFLNLNLKDVSGAVVSAVIVALVGYLSTLTNISQVDFNQILNISFLVGITSLLKALGTTESGKFGGIIPVK
jgi:hypothetical protein